MAVRLAGLVKIWFPESDYGFIEAEEVEYFCHASRLQNCYALAPSDKVRFTPEESKKRTGKREASEVYLMQRGASMAKASSAVPEKTHEDATVAPAKSSDNVASGTMGPWCKVALSWPADEKPLQPEPGSEDETEQSPANSMLSSSPSSSLSVGDEAELLETPETTSSDEEGKVDVPTSAREGQADNEPLSTPEMPSSEDEEIDEPTFAAEIVASEEVEKEQVTAQQVEEAPAQEVEEVPAQVVEEVTAQRVQNVLDQQVKEVPDQQVEQVAAQQVEEVTAQQVEEVAVDEAVEEKHFLGYTPPRCWPVRKSEEMPKHLAPQLPVRQTVQPAAPAKTVAGSAPSSRPEHAMRKKSAAELAAPAGQEVGQVGLVAKTAVRRAGLVTRWYSGSNYGFINDGRCEYFCHGSQLKSCLTLASSDQVTFTPVPSEKRPGKNEAREVYLIERGPAASAARS